MKTSLGCAVGSGAGQGLTPAMQPGWTGVDGVRVVLGARDSAALLLAAPRRGLAARHP